MKQKHFIDLSKGATPLVVLGCMFVYQSWDNPTAWAYLATHGTYGVLWVLKSRIFPDKNWEAACGFGYGMVILGGLGLYWGTPWMICAWNLQAPLWFLSLCVAIFGLGVFLHFAADMQKDATLKLKRGLITEGLFARTRNPNYLGELFIYAGFSALAMHWYPFVVLGLFMGVIWIPNMLRKDKSISRHEGWAQYKANTGLLFPKFFGRNTQTLSLVLFLLMGCASQVTPPAPASPSPPLDAGVVVPDQGLSGDVGVLDRGETDGGLVTDSGSPRIDIGSADSGAPTDLPCGEGGTQCPGGEYCSVPWGTCADRTEVGDCRYQDRFCDGHPDPVCGCDGLVYENQCQARLAGMNIQRAGPCDAPRCNPADGLLADRQCRGVSLTYCRAADGRCADEGYCVDPVGECHPDEGDGPVCGCDGQTYPTLCDLRQARAGFARMGICRERPGDPTP